MRKFSGSSATTARSSRKTLLPSLGASFFTYSPVNVASAITSPGCPSSSPASSCSTPTGAAMLALVWVANQYMSIYNHLRLDIKHEQVQIRVAQKKEDSSREPKAV